MQILYPSNGNSLLCKSKFQKGACRYDMQTWILLIEESKCGNSTRDRLNFVYKEQTVGQPEIKTC